MTGPLIQRTRFIRVLACGIALGFLGTSRVAAECGYDLIKLEGVSVDRTEACRAIRDVTGYFEAIGLKVPQELNIKVSDQVLLSTHNSERAEGAIEFQVSGYFDPAKRRIEVTSPFPPNMKERKHWGVSWSPDVAYSILRHEVAHAAIDQNFKSQNKSVSKAWMEFLAYAIQIELMGETLRGQVLANYPNAKPFETPERVNPFIYGYDPDTFGVSAYLYVREKGGREFIRKIITGETGYDLHEIFWTK